MLQAFLDDSGSEANGKLFALVGVVSTVERWDRFAVEWTAACDDEPRTPDFHMADAFRLKGGYWGRAPEDELRRKRDAKLLALASIVRKHGIVRVGSAVAWRAYEAAARGKVPSEIDSPYFFLFWNVIQAVARWQAGTGRREKVDFVFDDQGKIGIEAVSWQPWFLDAMSDDEKFMLASTPIFRHDSDVPQLKAADMCAWYFRREVVEQFHHQQRGEPHKRTEPMAALWEMPYAFLTLTEDGLRQVIDSVERAML